MTTPLFKKGDLVEYVHSSIRGTVVSSKVCKRRGVMYRVEIGNYSHFTDFYLCDHPKYNTKSFREGELTRVLPPVRQWDTYRTWLILLQKQLNVKRIWQRVVAKTGAVA